MADNKKNLPEEEAVELQDGELMEEAVELQDNEPDGEEEAVDEAENEVQEDDEAEDKPSKGRFSTKKKVITAVMIVFAFIVAFFAVCYGVFNHYYSKMNHRPLSGDYEIVSEIEPDDDEEVDSGEDSPDSEIEDLEAYLRQNLNEKEDGLKFDDKNVTNILLVGTDNRSTKQKGSRSDSMIILSVNRNTHQVVMTSLMRDTYLTIPKVGGNRLNAAFAYGGVDLLIDTIDANFKIPLDKYAIVDFYGFMDVVDTVGGVTLDVSAEEIKVMQMYIRELNHLQGVSQDKDMLYAKDAGTITLNGKQALAYSRVRYVGNADFGRTERQRKVLTQVFKKAKGMNLTEMNDLANALLPDVTTNLTQGEVISLLLHAGEYLDYDVVSTRMPVDGSYRYMRIQGMSVLGVDFEQNRKYWYETVYGGTASDSTASDNAA